MGKRWRFAMVMVVMLSMGLVWGKTSAWASGDDGDVNDGSGVQTMHQACPDYQPSTWVHGCFTGYKQGHLHGKHGEGLPEGVGELHENPTDFELGFAIGYDAGFVAGAIAASEESEASDGMNEDTAGGGGDDGP